MQLPEDFLQQIRLVLGPERFERYMLSFEEEAPVSIRVNPARSVTCPSADSVPWCAHTGCYLSVRPQFTFDPLLHAGCYYVQEAASMFLDEVLRQHLPQHRPLSFLDMCAAPGGKSTLIRSVLSEESILVSNEPVPKRSSILFENMQKWGSARSYVTSLYPKDLRKSHLLFDAILCDVPCSGEGMFRKDTATIGEWSQQGVVRCQQLQREIVSEAWQCLRPGGLLIYSTCTFNIYENEENVCWILREFDAQALQVDVKAAWGITGCLLPGSDIPVCRFIPGITRGEGLFMAAIRKGQSATGRGMTIDQITKSLDKMGAKAVSPLEREPMFTLDYTTAVSYLRGEAIILPPDVPRGLVTVGFMGQPLGQVKNIGSRANNLYPKEWRIKSTHIPDYPNVIHTTTNTTT